MSDTPHSRRNFILSMLILGSLFFIFGLVSWVNAILIPYLQFTCELSIVQSYLVTFAFYIAYLIMAIPTTALLNTVGYKRGMMIGSWTMALGALLFVPAAYFRNYGIFLAGLFSLGIGLAILQSAANPYITIIGDRESAARRLSIVGTFNKLAGILSILFFAALVMRESDKQLMRSIKDGMYEGAAREAVLDQLIRGMVAPYAILAVALFIFGLVVRYSVLPEIDTTTHNAETDTLNRVRTSVFHYPNLILGIVAMFFHTGSQTISLVTIIKYAVSMGLDFEGPAKNFPIFIMILTLVGYLFGVFLIPRTITQKNALVACTSLGLLLSFLVIFTPGRVCVMGMNTDISIWFLVMMGLPNALIYAAIWPLAINGLGRLTNLGSTMLVMGLCGSAILPLAYGELVVLSNPRNAYWIMVPCFAYLVFYAVIGHKIKHWRKTS